MRPILALPAFLLLTAVSACTITQQNGQDLRVEGPALISGQPWHVTQQYLAKDGDPVCTVSAGEMEVTQRSVNHTVVQQVATRNVLNPGQMYRLRLYGHIYETRTGWFSTADSEAIIQDMMNSNVVYTERQNQFLAVGEPRLSNSINTDDFAQQYALCKKFMK